MNAHAPIATTPWTPPTVVFNTADLPRDKANVRKLNAFVAGHIAIASAKPLADREAYLTKWADHVGAMANRLGERHLIGVTAFDIAAAVEDLVSAIPAGGAE